MFHNSGDLGAVARDTIPLAVEMECFDELPPDFREVLRNAALPISARDTLGLIMQHGRPAVIADRTPGGLPIEEARRELIEAGTPSALRECRRLAAFCAATYRNITAEAVGGDPDMLKGSEEWSPAS